MSFISGPYQVLWNGFTVGQIEDGITISEPGMGQVDGITGDDFGPGAMQDGVTQGGDCFFNFVLMEYNATVLRSMISPGSGGSPGVAVQPGLLLSSFAVPMILTKVSGSNAVPSIRTVPYAILAPNNRIEYFLGNRKRFVPVRVQALPYFLAGVRRFYVDT